MSNPITPLTPAQTQTQEAKAASEGYIKRVLVSDVDIPLNVLTDGLPDETISSRWARWSKMAGIRGAIGRAGSRMLDWFQTDHGARAIAGDAARARKVEQVEDASGEINQK